MASSNRPIGFSTGALAKGDFVRALAMLRSTGVRTVELSALREQELPRLAASISDLDLSDFDHVSVHAPSKLVQMSEAEAVKHLRAVFEREIPVVVHTDTVTEPLLWKQFSSYLLIENLDKRKPSARTAVELAKVFEMFPASGLCFDVAHARQVDPTMSEASQMLTMFHGRLRQIHASGLSSDSRHTRLSVAAASAFSSITHLIPTATPIVLESPVDEQSIQSEIEYVQPAFSPWLERLRSDIDDIFSLKPKHLRRVQIAQFLKSLQLSGTRLEDFDQVLRRLPTGGAYKPGDILLNTDDLVSRLSEDQKDALKLHLAMRVDQVSKEYPELKEQFRQQFS
jgi:hypothetical protein